MASAESTSSLPCENGTPGSNNASLPSLPSRMSSLSLVNESSGPDALLSIFSDEVSLKSLRSFAFDLCNEENILFVEEVLSMKREKDRSRIRDIFAEFIRVSSPMQINIDFKTREAITAMVEEKNFGKPTASGFKVEDDDPLAAELSVFDTALSEVLALIDTNIFTYFREELHRRANIAPAPPMIGTKRVVIVGGGFAGSMVAFVLDQMSRFDVTLVDSKQYFEYTPGMIQALCDPTKAESFRIDYKKMLTRGHLVIGMCNEVHEDHVVIDNQRLMFDYLVLTTGSSYTSQIKGRNVSTMYRSKKIMSEFSDLESAQRILVIGGGLVGVELSSEIAVKFPKKSVTLIDANNTVLKRLPEKAQHLALDSLKAHGVNVVLNQRVTSFDLYNREFITQKGEKFTCDKVYVATGPQPNSQFLKYNHSEWLTPEGFIKVNMCLQVEGTTNVFAGGDIANLKVEKLAYASLQHGLLIARNICRLEKGKHAVRFGEKGAAKFMSPPKAQIVSLADKSIAVLWGKYIFANRFFYDYKNQYQYDIIKMLVGQCKFSADFGRLPSSLSCQLGNGSRVKSTYDGTDNDNQTISASGRKTVASSRVQSIAFSN